MHLKYNIFKRNDESYEFASLAVARKILRPLLLEVDYVNFVSDDNRNNKDYYSMIRLTQVLADRETSLYNNISYSRDNFLGK